VSAAEQLPETPHQRTERGRITALGHRTESGERCTLLVIHELDGSWTFHGLAAPRVKLAAVDTGALIESILARAR
jgi:hypothetical protein